MFITQTVLGLMMLAAAGDDGQETNYIQAAIESPVRLEADLERDASRYPDRVLAFLEIAPGMHVLDLFSGGGYYSTIVSGIVGEDGSVTSHNNETYLTYAADELTQREDKGVPDNLVLLVSEANDLDLPEDKYDAALVILTWHDFYYVEPGIGWPKVDLDHIIATLCKGLKKGAVLGIVDHVAAPGGDPWEVAQTLHRIDPAQIRADLKGTCFRYKGEADFLRNESDDYSLPMSNPKVRGKTDRVVYKFRRK